VAYRGRLRVAPDELLLAALVLASGLTTQRGPMRRWEIPANVGTAVAAVAVARAGGASWGDLGLEPAAIPSGLREGASMLPGICTVVALGAALPATHAFFTDERVTTWSRGELTYHLVVRVPLATAAAEELLFRSALLGVELRRRPRRSALASTALAFGLWHVLPALRAHEANPSGARLADRVGGRPATVATTVAVTAAAGAGFAWLRLRSRSVVAPIVAHAAINAAALLATRVAAGRRPSSRRG
jgi:membrane protease YdiL (CAAX protease family)